VGGAGELFEDGRTGLRFQPGDAASLAAVLARLIGDPALLQRLARAGEQRARSLFSVEHAARQLEQLFTPSSNP